MFGMLTLVSGAVTIKGDSARALTQQRAVARGIGYVPREREVEGMTVVERMTLSQMGRYSTAGVLRVGQERALACDWIGWLSIKAYCELADCGNPQKVVLAKWRSGGADIMLLDHPTRGLDIRAEEHFYEMIRDM